MKKSENPKNAFNRKHYKMKELSYEQKVDIVHDSLVFAMKHEDISLKHNVSRYLINSLVAKARKNK